MDKKSLMLATAGASVLWGAGPAAADSYIAPARDGKGRVILLEPLTFVEIDQLDFGGFIIPASGSALVSIDAVTGTPTNDPGLVQLPQFTQRRGHFMGAGTGGQAVSVVAVFPGSLYLNGDTTSTNTIPVALELDNNVPELDGSYSYTIASDKTLDVYVGGNVTISAGMAPGIYSNEYQLTVTYQ